MQNNSNFRRSFGLDCLRGASIVIVLLNHALIGFFFSTGRLRFEGVLGAVSAFLFPLVGVISIITAFLSPFMIKTSDKLVPMLEKKDV